MDLLLIFLRRELRDIRHNNRLWPVYLVMPVLGIGIPVMFAFVGPIMAQQAATRHDAGMLALLQTLQRAPEFARYAVEQALTAYLLRSSAGFYLLLPVALSSTAAAFSIVGEKQQRTLEPILATPITDRQFLLGKLIASVAPTVLVTWAAGAVAVVLVDLITWRAFDHPVLPDRFWVLSLGVLSPLLAIAVVLVTMILSAKSTDPQATVQTTALVIIPGFLLIFGVFGRLLTTSFPALAVTCVIALALAVGLFRANVRRFKREEILTRWK